MNDPDPILGLGAVLSFYLIFFISFLIYDTLRQILQTPYDHEDFENERPKKPGRIRYIPQVQSQKRKKR